MKSRGAYFLAVYTPVIFHLGWLLFAKTARIIVLSHFCGYDEFSSKRNITGQSFFQGKNHGAEFFRRKNHGADSFFNEKITGQRVFLMKKITGQRVFLQEKITGRWLFSAPKKSGCPALVSINFAPSLTFWDKYILVWLNSPEIVTNWSKYHTLFPLIFPSLNFRPL